MFILDAIFALMLAMNSATPSSTTMRPLAAAAGPFKPTRPGALQLVPVFGECCEDLFPELPRKRRSLSGPIQAILRRIAQEQQ